MTNKDYKTIRKAAMIEASCILPSHYEVSKRFFNQVMKRFEHDKDLKAAAKAYYILELEYEKGDAT
tara:strand:+ start:354 stop:551 length:198 start_codon:yes stop_codon:yes gene_type:complete